ncbi:MAG: hypothetical protein JNM55_04390 [Anaerolineales bacterium]|nr:hypothetical protein [Anaerolineales bacterium]
MDVKGSKQIHGRFTLIVVSISVWIYIIWSLNTSGYFEAWRLWCIPSETPAFIDFRLIPSGAETFRSGIDPAISNPNDPKGNIFNYPKIWYLFFYTGITQRDTIWISTVLIFLFFLAVSAFPEKLTTKDSLLTLLVVFSPAAILLYERGNVDLAFFALCGLAIILVDRFPAWGAVSLLVASVFKLFPFFGVGVFLSENKDRFYRYLLICTFIFLTYVVMSFESLKAAWSLTLRGTRSSYGDLVIFDLFHDLLYNYFFRLTNGNWVDVLLDVFPHFIALMLLAIAFYFGVKSKYPLSTDSERNLTAFRMGACIYLGTFLLGNNWDYRLAFLIFTIPQISRWMSSLRKNHLQYWSVLGAFVVLLISCWYTFNRCFYLFFTHGKFDFYLTVFDEIMNWFLFFALAYLLAISAPNWVRSFSWKPTWREILKLTKADLNENKS